jgi:replication fork protection complex subunit Csm3/Swi3
MPLETHACAYVGLRTSILRLIYAKNMLGVWRDEAHGLVNGKRPGADEEDEEEPTALTDPSLPGQESDQAEYASSSSHAATRPPSSVDGEGDDDFETDTAAMDAGAKFNAQQTDSVHVTAGGPHALNRNEGATSETTSSRSVPDPDDDDLWYQIHGADNPAPRVSKHADVDDPDMWAMVGEELNSVVPSGVPGAKRMSDEEEEWNMVDEMEQNGDTTSARIPPPAGVSSVEEDCDDMYMDGS